MARDYRTFSPGYLKAKGLELRGFDEMHRMLDEMPDKLARQALRGAPNAAAAHARKELRQAAPRRTGRLRRAIKNARRDSSAGPTGVVYIEAGRKSFKNDAFYWRFLEYGNSARPFIRPTLDRLRGNGSLLRAMSIYIAKRFDKAVRSAQR